MSLTAISNMMGSDQLDLNSLLRTLLTDLKHAFAFSEYVFLSNGIYRSATERVAKYFVTDLSFPRLDSTHHENMKEILLEQIDVKNLACNFLVDLIVYGNSLTFIYLPFTRDLKCPRCFRSRKIDTMDFELNGETFTATCGWCGYSGAFERVDKPLKDINKVNIQRLDPKLVEIDYDPISGQTDYYMRLDNFLKRKIDSGDKHIIATIPWVFYQAAKRNKMVKFAQDMVFHLKSPGLAGMYQGWGIPQTIGLTEYFVKQHYYSKAELAILQDFIVPQRVLFPQSATEDPIHMLSTQQFKGHMNTMVREHRKDPRQYMVAPVPIGYQLLGGEGKSLQLSQEMEFNNKQQLAAAGFPAELYYMTFNIQVLPASLRLFENLWSEIPQGLNKWLKWVVDKISSFLQIEPPEVKWQGIRIADDIERRAILLQLAGSQQVSLATALDSIGIDLKEELEKLISQSTLQQEVIDKATEEQRIKSQVSEGAAPPGGMPGQQGGPLQPEALMAQAQQIAQLWMQMEETQRLSNMRELNEQNKILHDVAISMYEQMKEQIQQQGGQQALGAARQGAQAGAQGLQPPMM